MSSWAPTTYKTTNRSAYNDALKRRGSLTIWFEPEVAWRAPPTGKRGLQAPHLAKYTHGIDEESLVVRAVEVTTSNVGDAPMLPSYAIKSHPISALDRFPRTAPMTGSPDFDPDCLLGYAVFWAMPYLGLVFYPE